MDTEMWLNQPNQRQSDPEYQIVRVIKNYSFILIVQQSVLSTANNRDGANAGCGKDGEN